MTRRGLVLGAGGVLGASWTIGALRALEDVDGWDPRSEVVVGTSAGSVLAAFVAGGVGTRTLVDHQLGVVVEGDPRIEYDYETGTGGAVPPRPRWTIGSRSLAFRTALRPHRYPVGAAVSALAPEGRGTLAPVRTMVEAVWASPAWPSAPPAWIVAMDYTTGRRVAFGRPGAPPATLPDAVLASCSIPGWYTPVEIAGRRYVDGGVCSPTSADLLAGAGLDEVVVLAPMASFGYDEPRSWVARLERRLRRAWTRRLVREAEKVRDAGTRVTLLAPGPEDLRAIGVNLMDPRRRERVLETSLRTSAQALREARGRRGLSPGLAVAG
jgi:NTE family protein